MVNELRFSSNYKRNKKPFNKVEFQKITRRISTLSQDATETPG